MRIDEMARSVAIENIRYMAALLGLGMSGLCWVTHAPAQRRPVKLFHPFVAQCFE